MLPQPLGIRMVSWNTGKQKSPHRLGNRRDIFAVKDNAPMRVIPLLQLHYRLWCEWVYPLAPGEGLTAEPSVYAGVVYFDLTLLPIDVRWNWEAYGIRFDDCTWCRYQWRWNS